MAEDEGVVDVMDSDVETDTEFDVDWNDAVENASGKGSNSSEKTVETDSEKAETETGSENPEEKDAVPKNSGTEKTAGEEKEGEEEEFDRKKWLQKFQREDAETGDQDGEEETQKPEDVKEEKPADIPPDLEKMTADVLEDVKKDSKLREALETFSDDMPLFARLATAIVHTMLNKRQPTANDFEEKYGKDLEALRAFKEEAEEAAERQRHDAWDAAVEKEVPDWREIVDVNKNKPFREWFERQPPTIQACLLEARSPQDAIFALNKFKSDTGNQTKATQKTRNLYGNPLNDKTRVKNTARSVPRETSEDDDWQDAVEYARKHY